MLRPTVSVIAAALALTMTLGGCVSGRDYDDTENPGGDGDGDSDARVGSEEIYHPVGYGEASFHGPESNLQVENCLECHGVDLMGGTSNVSCDEAGCHKADWRMDCSFCHGGTSGGAPRHLRDLDGTTDQDALSFQAHDSHTATGNHAPFECSQCHPAASNMLSPGHAIDDTPGQAEVTFAGGLSPQTVYDRNERSCSGGYCHGDGRSQAGVTKADDPAKECTDCHADITSGSGPWDEMSGDHRKHLTHSVHCSDCHTQVVNASDEFINVSLHVNGTLDQDMTPGGISYGGDNCFGFCHSQFHFFDSW